MRKRIITHMNNDHADSVIRYAEHYGNASRYTSRHAKVEDVTLDKLVLSAGGRTISIPLDPPLKSFSEARERVVKMDQDCIEALGRDSITIKEYRAPKGFEAIIFATCFSTFILLSRPDNVAFVFQRLPEFAAFVLRIRLLVLFPMLAIHIFEASLMIRKLQRHSVPLFNSWYIRTSAGSDHQCNIPPQVSHSSRNYPQSGTSMSQQQPPQGRTSRNDDPVDNGFRSSSYADSEGLNGQQSYVNPEGLNGQQSYVNPEGLNRQQNWSRSPHTPYDPHNPQITAPPASHFTHDQRVETVNAALYTTTASATAATASAAFSAQATK
ncbi:hypothetical protein EG327_009309 [Venturia inaequalis]|uniref:DUF2470 domain-containing protein n=1 Tax=Venturia inaequalis TaxID=5025 RepID=A0A8H3VQQ4_VENIN|nr:hypothetical protein EG327_009309 [Venturia inaequalis]